MDSRTGIKIGLDVLWVSAHDDLIRVNSVHRSGIAHSTENTTYPDQYESRKVTHVKEALIALDNKLLDKIKYGIPSETEIDAAAAEADPDNATEAQKEAGNYKKGHLTIAGLAITIENPAGTVRHGNLKLRDHYGYIKRTEGADGDQVDVFVNSKAAEDYAGDVYVVDQMTEYTDDKTRSFDEHKVMLGYNNLIDARRGYKRNFNRDWKGEGGVTKMTLAEFKTWLAEPGANSRPASESNVTEAGRKARKDLIGKQRYASGRELAGAPTEAWTRKVLAGVKGAADIPDTMPMNVAVSELLKLQEQSAAFEAGEPFADVGPVQPTLDEVKTAIAPVESAMPGAPIEVLASYKQAPKIVQERMVAEKMTQVRAVFDPQTNKIYMFADQAISANDALMTALHEKAHRGLRQAFGEKLNPLLDDIFKNANETRKDNMDAIAAKYRLDPTVLEDQRVIAEELLAHMAEHDVSDGLVNKAVAFVRKLLRDLGFTQEFNDNDIRAIIREAQNSISRATDRTANRAAGVMIEEEVVVDETGEVYIVEQNAEQILTGIDKRIEICRKLRNCL